MDTKTRTLYMVSTRGPPQNKGHIQTKSEGMGKKKKKITEMEMKRKQESPYSYQIK